ncbi:hypothetical protein BT96DRAFT_1068449 [Gymnopus androsaceus JB14]|uniref:Uncharacterized protein n=1 Tax=Gymnopus androsaceus JB14 TaxID=1447944 RepID=A0A6A4I4Z7_9AGAR|nr:hypothetical protein BT96DRAFT_1068449 [Gymnopus androsaceus JB14]
MSVLILVPSYALRRRKGNWNSENDVYAGKFDEKWVTCRKCDQIIHLDGKYAYGLQPWKKHKNSFLRKGLDMPIEWMNAELGMEEATRIIALRQSGDLEELTSAPRQGQKRVPLVPVNSSIRAPNTRSRISVKTSSESLAPLAHPLPRGSRTSLEVTGDVPFNPVISLSPDDVSTCVRINMALPRVDADHSVRPRKDGYYSCIYDSRR